MQRDELESELRFVKNKFCYFFYRVSFYSVYSQRLRRPGVGVDHPLLPIADVKESVEL